MNKKSILKDSLITFGLTLLSMIVIFFLTKILPGQEKVIFPGDLYCQYAVFGRLFMNKLWEGSNFFYSWNIGMGGNTALLFAFAAMSPLNIIYMLIEDIEIATLIIVLMKPALAAAFFCVYGRYNLRQESKLVIAVAIGYGLCSFYCVVAMMNSIAEGLYFLPLVLIFVKHFLDTGKKVGLAMVYALSFLSFFYGGFIVGLSSLGYLCLCIFVHRHYSGRERMKILFGYAVSVVTAMLLSACVLLPAAYYAVSLNSTGLETEIAEFAMSQAWDILPCFLPGRKIIMDTPFPYLYCGLLTFIMMFFYFINQEIAKKERICVAVAVIVLILSMMLKPVYLFLHMFNIPNGYTVRFAYVLSFVAASAAVRQLSWLQLSGQQAERLSQIKLLLAVIFLAVTLGLFFCLSKIEGKLSLAGAQGASLKSILLTIALALLWIWMLYRYLKDKNGRRLVFLAVLLTMIESIVNGHYLMGGNGYYGREFYEERHHLAEEVISKVKAEDDGIYRIAYQDKHNYNMQTAYDYYGIAYFSSAVNETTSHALDRLGYARGDFTIYDFVQDEVMKTLLGTAYTIRLLYDTQGVEYEIIKNPYPLPLGYMVQDEILSYAFSENVFENQQRLLKCMTGKDVLCMEIYYGDICIYPYNVYDDGPDLDADEAYLKFTLPYQEEVKPYACFYSDFDRTFGRVPWVSETSDIILLGIEESFLSQPHTVPMEREGENYAVYIVFPRFNKGMNESFSVTNADFAFYHEDGLAVYHEELAKAGLQIDVMEDGYVKGRVVASEEKPVLFTSFPYEEGWKAYVDGKEQEIVPLLEGGFIGLRLETGEHEVELQFTAPYSQQGKWMSLCGLILLMILIIADLYDTKKVKER